MKALCVLIMLYLSFSEALLAGHLKLEDYISSLKQNEFSYDYKTNKENSLKLRDSWIQPINLSYNYSKSNPYNNTQTSKNTAISISQPIFESGGIYYGIKYAGALKRYTNLSIDVQKRKLIAQAVSLLIQIKQMQLQLKQQKLNIDNAKINLLQIKKQYMSGQVDSGSLDNAIIQKNSAMQTYFNEQTSKAKLISQFKTISDLNYNKAQIPTFKFITKKIFLNNNLLIDEQNAQKIENMYHEKVVRSKYLPSVSFNAGYNWLTTNNQSFGRNITNSATTDYYNYGLTISMPIDYNAHRDIEASKLAYLKSQDLLIDQTRASGAIFKQVVQNLQNYDKKIGLAKQSEKLYSTLLHQTIQLYSVGKKTIYDVDTLKNSLKIQSLNVKIFQLDKQLSLLNLYEQLNNAV